ncbi:MAG: Amidohydrolase 2 [Gemmatimonadetes bacterium]|nr:Amidohydrolase 2 [Gemmatimonadota bacterium]
MVRNLHYVPNAYSAQGNSGFVAGTVRVGTDYAERMNFQLGIVRRPGAAWQVASEVLSVIPPPEYAHPITAAQLVEELDDAGIARGVVLSVGYWFGNPKRQLPDSEAWAKARAENDWTVAQVGQFPDRLVALCGVNPRASYALTELERCATLPHVKGMKLHFSNSGVDVKNPAHVEKLRRFFTAANARHMALVIHARQRGAYTREHAAIIVSQLIPAAPDVSIQVAHMGSGDFAPDEASDVFVDAIASGNPVMRNVWLDMTQTVLTDGSQSAATLSHIASVLRRAGLHRILFGTDMTGPGNNPPPREHWKAIRRLRLRARSCSSSRTTSRPT